MGNSLRQLYLIVVESESDNVAAFPANRAPGHTRANAAAETNLVQSRSSIAAEVEGIIP